MKKLLLSKTARSITLFIMLSIPLGAHALMMNIQKPSRGNYGSVADEGAANRKHFQDAYQELTAKPVFSYIPLRVPSTTMQVNYPETWQSSVRFASDQSTEVHVYPPKDVSDPYKQQEFMWIMMEKAKKDLTAAELDARFERDSTPSNDTSALGDWYIPDMRNLEKTDMRVGADIPARRYSYTSTVGMAGEQTGIAVLFSRGNRVYELWMRSPSEHLEATKQIFEHMLETVAFKDKVKVVDVTKTTKKSRAALRRKMRSARRSG